MKKKVSGKKENGLKKSYGEDQVLAMFESLQNNFGILAEGQQAIRDELREFKGEMYSFKENTEKNFKIVFEYFSRLDDEIAEIKVELKERKKNEEISKKWVVEIEERIARIEKQLRVGKAEALKRK